MVISVTRLRLRSVRFLPAFFWNSFKVNKQVVRANGFMAGKTFLDSKRTFWTMTAWRDPDTMKSFRNTAPHQIAMRKLPHWCDEASYTRWEQETDDLPDWKEAHRKLSAEPVLSPVQNPSRDHAARRFADPRWPSKLEQTLRKK
jgi:hypothetical protein